jgi:hypothetical protein
MSDEPNIITVNSDQVIVQEAFARIKAASVSMWNQFLADFEAKPDQSEMIDSRHLSRLSGVPAWKIREWRHRGFIPKKRRLPRWWVDVVEHVHLAPKTLPELFKSAKEAHKP